MRLRSVGATLVSLPLIAAFSVLVAVVAAALLICAPFIMLDRFIRNQLDVS